MGKPQQLELLVLTIPFQQCDCVNNSRDQWRGQENPQPVKGADAGVATLFKLFFMFLLFVLKVYPGHFTFTLVQSLPIYMCISLPGLLVANKGVGLFFFGGG